jgi:hypothetical protein
MATLQHEALKAIAGGQEEAFAFCELHGVYYHPMEPSYLTMGRIASWALLMKNGEVTKIPATNRPLKRHPRMVGPHLEPATGLTPATPEVRIRCSAIELRE